MGTMRESTPTHITITYHTMGLSHSFMFPYNIGGISPIAYPAHVGRERRIVAADSSTVKHSIKLRMHGRNSLHNVEHT